MSKDINMFKYNDMIVKGEIKFSYSLDELKQLYVCYGFCTYLCEWRNAKEMYFWCQRNIRHSYDVNLTIEFIDTRYDKFIVRAYYADTDDLFLYIPFEDAVAHGVCRRYFNNKLEAEFIYFEGELIRSNWRLKRSWLQKIKDAWYMQ